MGEKKEGYLGFSSVGVCCSGLFGAAGGIYILLAMRIYNIQTSTLPFPYLALPYLARSQGRKGYWVGTLDIDRRVRGRHL